MLSYAQTSKIISDKDEMLKSIWTDTPGRYQLDDESGEPDTDCACAKLVGDGYAGISLASADAEDWRPLNFCATWSFPEIRLEIKKRIRIV